MRFGVQRQQTLIATTELVIWRYANAFISTNQSELNFGIAFVFTLVKIIPFYYSLSLFCHYPPCGPTFDSGQAHLAGGSYVLQFPLSPFWLTPVPVSDRRLDSYLTPTDALHRWLR
jgi:hypothetical protein